MDKSLFLGIKKSVESLEGFHGSHDLFLEEERTDPLPFQKQASVRTTIDTGTFDIAHHSKKFSSVYFIDGIQRTLMLGEIDTHPLFVHFSGAAIMRRKDGVITPFGEPLMHASFITSSPKPFESTLPIERVDAQNPLEYYARSSSLRENLERTLLKKSLKIVGSDEIIVYDGRLVFPEVFTPGFNVLGVIKRHASLYVPDKSVFYSLKHGQRTGAFTLGMGDDKDPKPVVSFYQKLFPKKDPYYSVVRVEVPHAICQSVSDVNAFAGFVHSERFPLDMKTHQSGKKLYPISVCEKFLSSKLPSIQLVSVFLRDALQ